MNAIPVVKESQHIELGEHVDGPDGLPMLVREVTVRHSWINGAAVTLSDGDRTMRLRHGLLIRSRVPVDRFGPLRGHARRVHSHSPVKRGWYTDPNGWDAECGCGWTGDTVHATEYEAEKAWLAHKAEALAEAEYTRWPALRAVQDLERDSGLPRLRWTFGRYRFAYGHLPVGLGRDQAREVMRAWARAIGDPDPEDETFEGEDHGTGRWWMTTRAHLTQYLVEEQNGRVYGVSIQVDARGDASGTTAEVW